MLRVFAYSCCYHGDAGVDPAVIETRADELIGSVSKDEYKALAGHLGGARRNRVFHALGVSAPPRSAELKLAEGHGGPEKAKALEKAKRKKLLRPRSRGRESGCSIPFCSSLLCGARGNPKMAEARTAIVLLRKRRLLTSLRWRCP